jgi:hypothetical protein
MDEKTLRQLLLSLENNRNCLDHWLFFWTLLVVAGVVLEVVFVVWEYRDQLHEFRRALIEPPSKPKLLLFGFGLFGSVLVAAGVAGELWIGVRIGTAESNIRKANDDLSVLLSQQAGSAKDSAEAAANAAGIAKQAADDAILQARGSKEALVEYKGRAGARRLSLDQQNIFLIGVANLSTPISVKFNYHDPECKDFAEDFVSVLKRAGKSSGDGTVWFANGKYGVFIASVDIPASSPQIKLLHDALRAIHVPGKDLQIPPGSELIPPPQSGVIYLLIGTHPPVESR